MNTHNFDQLDVWRRACRLASDVCVALHHSKEGALKDEAQRSAISIPTTIAEGARRPSRAAFLRFLRYSKRSCNELRAQLMVHLGTCRDLNLEPALNLRDLIDDTGDVDWMISTLIQRIENEGKS